MTNCNTLEVLHAPTNANSFSSWTYSHNMFHDTFIAYNTGRTYCIFFEPESYDCISCEGTPENLFKIAELYFDGSTEDSKIETDKPYDDLSLPAQVAIYNALYYIT